MQRSSLPARLLTRPPCPGRQRPPQHRPPPSAASRLARAAAAARAPLTLARAPPAAPRRNWVRRPKWAEGAGPRRRRAQGAGGLLPRRGVVTRGRLRVTSRRLSSCSRSRPRRPSARSGLRPPLAAAMANVADTKLYDILGVPPGASDNELKKVRGRGGGGRRPGGPGGSAVYVRVRARRRAGSRGAAEAGGGRCWGRRAVGAVKPWESRGERGLKAAALPAEACGGEGRGAG